MPGWVVVAVVVKGGRGGRRVDMVVVVWSWCGRGGRRRRRWVIVISDLLGLGRLVRGRLESVVPDAWSGIVLRVPVPPSRIEDHTRWTGPSTGSGLQLTCPRAGSLQ